MRRIAAVAVLTSVLGLLAFVGVRIDSDARALLGPGTAPLDLPEGRALSLAIVDPDRDRRSALAREIAAVLASDSMVEGVALAAGPLSDTALEWLWAHRFALSPPPAEAFTAEALSAELIRARRALTEITAAPLAMRYLLDPSGGFRRLVEGLLASRNNNGLPDYDGVPQARDDSAAIVFIELADRPFEVAVQSSFDRALRDRIAASGAEALMVGPRTFSAEISSEIAGRSALAAGIAGALVLGWLGTALRSSRGLLASLLPPALGFVTGLLAVAIAFGSVHVLALGFGGVLIGLAVDYPLHLMAHGSRPDRVHVRHCIRLGAATTIVAFMALTLAGLPAMAQVGVFGAAGLVSAAAAALWMDQELPYVQPFRAVSVPSAAPASLRMALLILASAVAAVGIWHLPAKGAARLLEIPAQVSKAVARLDQMIGLPSGRYRVEVSGGSLKEVLGRQGRLDGVLVGLQEQKLLTRFEMLARYLPAPLEADKMPTPGEFSDLLIEPLSEAGLRDAFRKQIVAAYSLAREHRDVQPSEIAEFVNDSAAGALIRIDGENLIAPAMLWDIKDPAKVAAAVDALADPAIRFIDREAAVARGLDRVVERVRLCLALGASAALFLLAVALRRKRAVVEIAAGCIAATLITAWIAGTLSGGIGIFQIIALTLVMGIGIDYGLLLSLSGDDVRYGAALRSVLLCATTTLVAFIPMAVSGVGVLEDIGMTVTVGVVAMLAAGTVRSRSLTGARTS